MAVSFLATQNLILRPLALADADGPYVSWFNDEEVCRLNSHHVRPYTRDQAIAYINSVAGNDTDLVLAVVLREGNRHIGNIALQAIDTIHRSAELAIVIGEKDCWGKGYSKEAAAALVQHAFLTLNLNRVHCATPSTNQQMRRLATSLGMVEEGCRRQAMFKNGSYLDVVEYGVLASEFAKRDTADR